MNSEDCKNFGRNLVPENYLKIGLESRRVREKKFRLLLEKRKIPDSGWKDDLIEEFITYLSSLDSNNFMQKLGLGEREARIACQLVARRHYNFGHGIGRSGDLLEPQPKAAGSSLMAELTNALLLDLLQKVGIHSTKYCFLVPMATGMTLNLCFQSIRKKRPQAKYILWSRIDQKACFKSMTTAGFIPIIIDVKNNENANDLVTNLEKFQKLLKNCDKNEILCIFSTTSCFAPRNCDKIIEMAKLAKDEEVPHVVNNAYGLQSTFLTHQIEQAYKLGGRIDLYVQSTDKNLMVPVGGAIVAGFAADTVKDVAKSYAGRASSSQTLDVLITLLSLGTSGYLKLIKSRKENFVYLTKKISNLSKEYNEVIIPSKNNPISIAISLNTINGEDLTRLGSMLFTRGVSGARVINLLEEKMIDSYEFKGWGSHCETFSSHKRTPYLTVAAGLGVTTAEIDSFIEKLRKCLVNLRNNQR